jgi:hypothetical protein
MQITFLPHVVLPRLVRHPLAPVQVLVRRESVVEHRLKGKWNSNNRGIKRQHIHFLWTSTPKACKLPYSGCLTRVSSWRTPLFAILLEHYAS